MRFVRICSRFCSINLRPTLGRPWPGQAPASVGRMPTPQAFPTSGGIAAGSLRISIFHAFTAGETPALRRKRRNSSAGGSPGPLGDVGGKRATARPFLTNPLIQQPSGKNRSSAATRYLNSDGRRVQLAHAMQHINTNTARQGRNQKQIPRSAVPRSEHFILNAAKDLPFFAPGEESELSSTKRLAVDS
jgi:hypothetical protein